MPTPNINQLKRAVAIAEQIEKLQGDLAQILDGSASVAPKAAPVVAPAAAASTGGKRRRHTMSAAGRARIVAAQKARWAKVKSDAGSSKAKPGPKKGKKRKLSPEARARISAAVKARWAREKGA